MRFIRSLLMTAALAAAPIATASCQQIPPPKVVWVTAASSLPFLLYRGNRIVTRGTVNGKAVDFILDTGASVTTLDKAYARSIGIPEGFHISAKGAGGMEDAEVVHGVSLAIGGLKLDGVTVAVIDLSPIASQVGRPVEVILGRDFFDNAALEIDWATQQLSILNPSAMKPAPSSKEVRLSRKGPFNYLDISVEGLAPVTAILDLGNGLALTLPDYYWSRQPILSGRAFAATRSGGVGGQHDARLVTLDRVNFGGQDFSAVPAVLTGKTREGAADMPNVGIGMLRQFAVTLDLGNNRMFLEPLAGKPQFRRDRSGVKTTLVDGKLDVSFVSPGSPAALAGAKAGDRIAAINGLAVDGEFYSGRMSDWAERKAGTPVELTLADGRKLEFTLADYF